MSWRVRFTRLADADVAEAFDMYEAARVGLGADFLDDVGRGLGVLEAHPESGPAVSRVLRRLVLHRFPYSLYYTLDAGERVVEIRACVHQRRHPQSWRGRG